MSDQIEKAITIPIDMYHRLEQISEIMAGVIDDDQQYEQASALLADVHKQVMGIIEDYSVAIEALKEERHDLLEQITEVNHALTHWDYTDHDKVRYLVEQIEEMQGEISFENIINVLRTWSGEDRTVTDLALALATGDSEYE